MILSFDAFRGQVSIARVIEVVSLFKLTSYEGSFVSRTSKVSCYSK